MTRRIGPDPAPDGAPTPAEVAALFDDAGTEAETIERLEGCLAQLQRAHHAKAALTELSIPQLKAGLAYRNAVFGGDRP